MQRCRLCRPADLLAQTEGQIDRLEQVLEIFGQPARVKKCEAIEGIIAEGDMILKEFKGTAALDAGLISSAQADEQLTMIAQQANQSARTPGARKNGSKKVTSRGFRRGRSHMAKGMEGQERSGAPQEGGAPDVGSAEA